MSAAPMRASPRRCSVPDRFPTSRARAALLAVWALPLAACPQQRSERPGPSASPAVPAPSGPEIGPELRARLEAALRAKGPGYVPRTRHRHPDGTPRYTNRLILEASPYLLQHAHNPVSWFPWGEEAFAAARSGGRPVFLSVGYATCHWCHVMEEESFEDEAIARFLNEHYVCIKVDREERPDVDGLYMQAVQRLTGGGGWPMSVWLTPQREPFFAGTYFPPRDGARGARKGFDTVLREQLDAYRAGPGDVAARAARLASEIRRSLQPQPSSGLPGRDAIEQAVRAAAQRFDPEHGGTRGAPKFPSSFPVRLLLRHHRASGDRRSLEMALVTLRRMAQGGIHDHVGGGFHRYATDRRWLVPHFEKMLYDNALLAVAYLEGYQASGDAALRDVAARTLDYLVRDMTSPEGGLWSATDADSPAPGGKREEGWAFTWTPAEIEAVVGAPRIRAVQQWFAVEPAGNFEGRSILHAPRGRDEVAGSLGIAPADLDRTLAEALPLLRAARAKRPPPLLDDKLQASWNGLAITALARGALVIGEPRFRAAAERAAELVLRAMRPGGRLVHSLTRGRPGEPAFLDDHAMLAAGLLDLFELTAEPRWLDEAITLMETLERDHGDPVHGGYFLVAADRAELLAREKPGHDGAVPSGNSIALMNHLRLHELTGDERWRARAETTLRAFATTLAERPWALDQMLLGLDFMLDEALEIAIVVPATTTGGAADPAPLLDVLRRSFVPNHVLVVAGEQALAGPLGAKVPWAKGKPARGGRARAYVCVRGACDLPTGDPEVFRRQIERRRAGVK
jgi:hypothetical protein